MIYKCQICATKPLTAWVILKWSLLKRCWTFIYKHNFYEIFICGIFWTTYALPLYVQIFVNESPTNIVRAWIKAIGKESSYVRIYFLSAWQNFYLRVFTLHRRIKKGKMMKSYVMNGYHQSSLKKHWQKTFFPEKHSCLLKKKLSMSEMKKLLHPGEISVKFQIFFYLFITSNSPM